MQNKMYDCLHVTKLLLIRSTLHVKIWILWSGRVSRHRMSESQPNLVRKRDPIPGKCGKQAQIWRKNTTGKGRGEKRHNKAIYKGLFRGKWGDLRLGKLSPESRVDKNGKREHARNSDEERERKRKRRLWEFDFVAWSRNKVNNYDTFIPFPTILWTTSLAWVLVQVSRVWVESFFGHERR